MDANNVNDNKKHIDQLFNSIAGRYDLINHVLTLGIDILWRKKAARQLKDILSDKSVSRTAVLDVACGTGDMITAVEKAGNKYARNKRIDITGADISPTMAFICGKKHSAKYDIVVADVKTMPFKESSFDAVTCAFGVRNFDDLNKGLYEMIRVMKSGGKLVITEFSYPENKLVRFFYNIYFTYFLPYIGGLLSGKISAYKYFCKSVKVFPKTEDFTSILQSLHLKDVKHKPLTFGIANIYTAYKP